jgi:hypothetical protein
LDEVSRPADISFAGAGVEVVDDRDGGVERGCE